MLPHLNDGNPMLPAIPVLETRRLVLRGHRLADFSEHAAFWADPIVTRFIGGRPLTREEAWMRFLRHAGMWANMGFGFWAVTDRASGRLLGEAGFHELRRELTPRIEGSLETGWSLVPDVHGQGLATEMLGAILAWGAENFPGKRITCLIDPDNAASLRLARKLGFREIDRSAYHGSPIVIFERPPIA